jgi:hypothetical protein
LGRDEGLEDLKVFIYDPKVVKALFKVLTLKNLKVFYVFYHVGREPDIGDQKRIILASLNYLRSLNKPIQKNVNELWNFILGFIIEECEEMRVARIRKFIFSLDTIK